MTLSRYLKTAVGSAIAAILGVGAVASGFYFTYKALTLIVNS